MSLAWPLIGRLDEVELVERALVERNTAGVVIAGAAGVGKTRLAGELLARAAAAGLPTAWAQATLSAGAIPFGAFAHLLPRQLGEAGPVNVLRVAGEAITGGSVSGQLVLGVDDAHLLDGPSAALVGHLARSESCFVVVTVRTREPTPDAIVNLSKDGSLARLDLQPLSEADVAELLTAVLGGPIDGATKRRLWESSRGNPLYLHEVVCGGIESGRLTAEHHVWRWRGPLLATPRLSELIESRLVGLSAEQRAVLEIVARAEPLETALLDAMTDPLDREFAERSSLLETLTSGRRRSVRLSHPLYAEVIRASTPPSTVRSVWHRLAELLGASGARRRGDQLRLATWRLDAGDVDDGELFLAAAKLAVDLLDHALAARLALAAVEVDGGFEAHLLHAVAVIGMGDGARAEEILSALTDHTHNDDERVRLAIRRADNLFWRLGDGPAACAVLQNALGTVVGASRSGALLVSLAGIQLFSGATAPALETIENAIACHNDDHALLVQAVPAWTWGRILQGRTRDAFELIEHRLPSSVFDIMGGPAEFTPVYVNATRGAAALIEGRVAYAELCASEAFESSLTPNKAMFRGFFGFWLGWTRRVRGLARAAVSVLVETDALLREADLYRHRSASLGELAHCYALLGEVRAAEDALAEAEAARVTSFVMDYSYVMGARVWLAQARGEHANARRLAGEWARACASYGQTVFAAFAWHDLARLGDADAAAGPLNSIATDVDGALIPTFAAHAAALAADDAAGLDRVASAFEQMGAALYAAEAAASAANSFRRDGRTGSALTAAARCHSIAAQCEGVRTPALERVDGSLPLTARELEIAGLAAGGLANRAIAELLFVSVRTVDNHLHSVYGKLGVRQRSDLAAILHPALGTTPPIR